MFDGQARQKERFDSVSRYNRDQGLRLALAEALTVGRNAGVDGELLFDTLSKGSADSFALRSHGLKSMLPGEFPTQAFSTDYAAKDLSYAMQLAQDLGIELAGAETARKILAETSQQGYGQEYYPALLKVIDPDG